MYGFHPYFTNDGSVGLYNSEVNDIYHSASGALSEAYDKFINPIDFASLLSKEKINILDICYGIGYNTKSFLNYFLNISENFSKKIFMKNHRCTNNIETIYTNNSFANIAQKLLAHNDPIYTNNIFNKISITAIDNDKILFGISPFIKTGCKNISKYKPNFSLNNKNIGKYLSHNNDTKPKINNLINYVIFDSLYRSNPELFNNDDIISLLNNKDFSQIFENNLKGILSVYLSETCPAGSSSEFFACLHNIYYRYLSKRYKKAVNSLKIDNVKFRPIFSDARTFIKNDNSIYNLIFLDAFTPAKCPCLWSYEFFKALYAHLEEDGMLLTYSTSSAVRNAMIEAGFCIGNNIKDGKIIGTVATKNSALIKYPLSEYDFGLLKTRAGIFYRDENLSAPNEAITERRKNEVKNSKRISTTKYIKSFKKVK